MTMTEGESTISKMNCLEDALFISGRVLYQSIVPIDVAGSGEESKRKAESKQRWGLRNNFQETEHCI